MLGKKYSRSLYNPLSDKPYKLSRSRIDNFQKFVVLTRSYVKYQLNLILWI